MQITPSGFKKPSGVTQWSTLLRNNRELSKLYGRDVINTSRAGYDIYRASSSVQCVLDSACSSKLFAAKTHSVKQHINRCHSDIGRVRAQPTIEQSMQKHSATRSTLTAAEARHLLATKASMELFALGISAHTIDMMMREVALPLLFATGQLPCTATMLREGGACDDEVRDLKIHLCTLLAGIPVALFVDGSDTHFSHGKKIVHVMADSAALDHPMLLAVRLENDVSCNAVYYSALLNDVIDEYQLNRSNIVGVATDNTSVMPKGVRLAGLPHLPCAVHVLDLMLEGIAKELGFHDLLGWHEFAGRSVPRRADMAKAGLNVACCRGEQWEVASTPFAPLQPASQLHPPPSPLCSARTQVRVRPAVAGGVCVAALEGIRGVHQEVPRACEGRRRGHQLCCTSRQHAR